MSNDSNLAVKRDDIFMLDVQPASPGYSVLTPVIGHPERGVFEFAAVIAEPIESWRIEFDRSQMNFTVTPIAGYRLKVLPEIWALEWPDGGIRDPHCYPRWFACREELLEWWQNYIHDLNDEENYIHRKFAEDQQ
jgi:hypothetical protein